MDEIKLSKESVQELATEIARRLFQGVEKAFTDDEAMGSLGKVLRSIQRDMEKREAEARKKKGREERIRRINDNYIPDGPAMPREIKDESGRTYPVISSLKGGQS